jgi:LCP family protein required for cell wall assembly
MMDLPLTRKACGRQAAERHDRFNAAYDNGGPACTVAAAERLTGIQVDNVLVVDFTGFEKIVNALGGLKVCLRHPVYDRNALLDLPAGTRKVGGKDALALMRARKAFGNRSDIGRTARQQYLITQIVTQVRARGLLSNPARLYRIASAATRSLTTDKNLGSVDALLDLATQVSGVEEKRIHLTTLPWLPDPANPTVTVVIDEDTARPLLRAMTRDEEPGVRRPTPTASPAVTPGSDEQPTTTTTTAAPATTTSTTTDPSVTDTFCDVNP